MRATTHHVNTTPRQCIHSISMVTRSLRSTWLDDTAETSLKWATIAKKNFKLLLDS